MEFYPSITEDLLGRALDFASNYVTISAADRHVIMHAKQSLLFSTETPWQKRNSNTLFDVTMGSFDGAETCELVGCYLLSQLTQISDLNIGLYRDDGLAVLNQTPHKIERVKKETCRIFANNNLRITVEANKKTVNFLDVTLDLTQERFVTSHGKTYTNVLTFNSLKSQLAVSHRQSAVSNPLVNVRRFHQTVRRIHQTVRRIQQTVSSMEKALVVTL